MQRFELKQTGVTEMIRLAITVAVTLLPQVQGPVAPLSDAAGVSNVTVANATGLYHRDGCAWLKGSASG
jgi:hypothetical protein